MAIVCGCGGQCKIGVKKENVWVTRKENGIVWLGTDSIPIVLRDIG